ncbi:uncharacterized protein LOC127278253 [Leptopilina boulardi]|uniref:uncharacterized protein LOC127278253 n=1 Tax=Leptopilina boulardi TaxID=63433 RepID=UPI0021F57F8B|nr:uncharacterized protein LOC127278253 [Leptopilina boulardi]XP_051155824.1 uncharacterized protein LOC127278253 [Leptopilina boulardi]
MNSHSAVPNSDEYIPPNTVYVPTTTYNSGPIVDFSFIRTKFGLLKILQQLFISFGAITFIWGISGVPHLISLPMLIGFFLYIILISTLLPAVHVLMWLYILHKVEHFHKYPWYSIELTVCGVGAALCCLCAFAPLYTFLGSLSALLCFALIFTLITAALFIYNFYLVNQRKNMKLPLQGSEFAMFSANLT